MPTRKAAPDTGLLAALEGEPPRPNTRTECRLAEEIAKRPAKEAAAIKATIDNPKWKSRTLAAVLTEHGFAVSAGAVQNHRNGVCPCYRNREAEK